MENNGYTCSSKRVAGLLYHFFTTVEKRYVVIHIILINIIFALNLFSVYTKSENFTKNMVHEEKGAEVS